MFYESEHRGKGPKTSGERMFYYLFILVLIVPLVLEFLSGFSMAKLSALFLLLFWIPLLAIHELGHAMMACFLGWRVGRIVIGAGANICRLKVGDVRIELNCIPYEGFMTCYPGNLKFPRLKNGLIYFAGPGIELLLAGLAVRFVGADVFFQKSQELGIVILQSFALSAVVGAVINLIPHRQLDSEGGMPNDGMGILYSPFLPDEYFERLMREGESERIKESVAGSQD